MKNHSAGVAWQRKPTKVMDMTQDQEEEKLTNKDEGRQFNHEGRGTQLRGRTTRQVIDMRGTRRRKNFSLETQDMKTQNVFL